MFRAVQLWAATTRHNVQDAIGSLLARAEKTGPEGELVYRPGQAELERTKGEIEALGVRCLAMDLDVTSDASVEAFHAATLAAFGKVDILANAAGISAEQTVSGHSDALWQRVLDVNLTGTYRAIKRVLPGMIQRRWGRIVNIASTAASVGAAVATGGVSLIAQGLFERKTADPDPCATALGIKPRAATPSSASQKSTAPTEKSGDAPKSTGTTITDKLKGLFPR